MVTRKNIQDAVLRLGVQSGDICLVHSSFKSLGSVENGAADVIGGFEDALGPEGTLVFPTLCQKDFSDSYKTWHLDKPSDVGYLTNYFRKLPGALRSDQATHSVAARGALAHELTKEHCGYGPHLCPYGIYAFAESSPWAKMYRRNAKIVFLGVSMGCNTIKHMIEGRYAEELLAAIDDEAERRRLQSQLQTFEDRPNKFWLYYRGSEMQPYLESLGLVRQTVCGNATLYCVDAKTSSDAALDTLRAEPERWYTGESLAWIQECKASAGK